MCEINQTACFQYLFHRLKILSANEESGTSICFAWKRDWGKLFKLPWWFNMAVKNGAYSLEEKREAVAFFNKNEVPKQIEDLLNKMFKEKPNDVFGYMVRIFFPVLFFFRVSLRRPQSCTIFTNSFYEYIRLVLGLMSAYKSDEKNWETLTLSVNMECFWDIFILSHFVTLILQIWFKQQKLWVYCISFCSHGGM